MQQRRHNFIECKQCGDVAKIAKNVGNHWKDEYQFLADFLLEHSECPTNKIKLRWVE